MEKDTKERNGMNFPRTGIESGKKEEKKLVHRSNCKVFPSILSMIFFLSSTASVRKGKRKLRSHGTALKQGNRRKLNHTDAKKAENVSKRSPTVFIDI